MKLLSDNLMTTYKRLPVSFLKGQGVWLSDKNKNQYLDALSGVAVNTLGHSHPRFVKAISDQIEKLIHVSNYYHIEEQSLLAKRITQLSNLSSVFFCNSGSEANEVAIKLARLHGHKLNIDQPNIIVMEKSFHGRTMATLSATGSRKVQAGFEPLMSGFIRVPFDDVDSVNVIAKKKNKVAAILVEPIQGEGGINISKDFEAYLSGLRKLCDENNWLLIFDEVQTGIGRTGKWFAHQYTSIKPDVMTLAKGLGSGIPIGACVVNDQASKLMTIGKHGSTFGGNPLAMVAGITTLKIVEEEGLLQNALKQGLVITNLIKKKFNKNNKIKSIRHMGLMIGIELNQECNTLVDIALKNKLLINVIGDSIIRLLPPLVINDDEAILLANKLITTMTEFFDEKE